ncbi:unnamed protein product [Clonostachys rosea f. rosea IK726]|uniref:Tr-type G domain-containing protein n=2 Tax=Bionectria ochroleuca TaxID=29856 RepID=A0A0B7KLA9_BIOOC|nr:unnamed protein product [Clonostachys rosea f. rosea IK726]
MASIFTYDPDPPRISSPWLSPEDPGTPQELSRQSNSGLASAEPGLLSDYGVTKLEAEPQDGPTEYKLHLLLRPRRAYKSMTTIPAQSQTKASLASQDNGASLSAHPTRTSTPAPAQQPRQQRLLHLTTQLLWRLQQSSPYHASSSKEIPMPKLPDDNVPLEPLKEPDSLVPGLDESRGALYEIGVSDDGTLVGLTKDEMDESIKTLKVMASSLGCTVEVLRMVIVGNCEWIEQADDAGTELTRHGKLWVAEALVTPNLRIFRQLGQNGDGSKNVRAPSASHDASVGDATPSHGISLTPQLRVTFTGPTTSGKSSLLGTLSTGTLDNGRGKSRLSLLRHRHEMVSGVTSSIAQELIGYKDQEILNFSQGNIESWMDIHDCADGGRLVFVSDSGGHPRYRRTVLRGLMNWAPHWSILCIASDDGDPASMRPGGTSTAQDVLGAAAAGVDLVSAHLTLSLKLEVPMAIVVTKLDLASKTSLQKTMSKILTAIKAAGRVPKILQPDQSRHEDLQRIPQQDHDKVQSIIKAIAESGSLTQYVPIVLTSVVKGTGVGLVHALLQSLPLPPPPTSRDFVGMALNPEQPNSLFHIDDTFSLPSSFGTLAGGGSEAEARGVVISGHLRFGDLSVGDEVVVGPFPPEEQDSGDFRTDDKASPGNYGLSISHPASSQLAKISLENAVSASTIAGEWHKARIVSVRNLRLPVRTLKAGQAGSIGLVLEPDEVSTSGSIPRIRRGMVLAIPSKHMVDTGLSLQAASGFTATFTDPDMESLVVGSLVNVYVASVRATARVRGISRHSNRPEFGRTATEDIDVFNLSEDFEELESSNGDGIGRVSRTEVFLELLHNREWVELGSRVIILEGGSQDRSGLEGYVGKIIEIVD